MTDRVHTLVVVLEQDLRRDDVEPIAAAIKTMRGVLSVTGEIVDTTAWMAAERAKHDLGQKILKVIYPTIP